MARQMKPESNRRRKVFAVDRGLLQALDGLSRDEGADLDALADEAFRDLLRKHRRPLSLKEALRDSARTLPANDGSARSRRRTP